MPVIGVIHPSEVRIGDFEEWTIGADGLIAGSLGHCNQADWDRKLGKTD